MGIHFKFSKDLVIAVITVGLLAASAGVYFLLVNDSSSQQPEVQRDIKGANIEILQPKPAGTSPVSPRPIAGKRFYTDKKRPIVRYADQLRAEGKVTEANYVAVAASQPSAVWLVGPSSSDPQATRDFREVARTSSEAFAEGATPIYQLYAIPKRDACAGYSKGGFATDQQYMDWLAKILNELRTDAIFIIEADAVGHAVKSTCLSPAEVEARYKLLSRAASMLASTPKVAASYIDAGHSHWFPDPKELTQPLKKAGVAKTDGVAVNVSNFIGLDEITPWSKSLVSGLGDKYGVVIDTSRNGRGAPHPSVTGDARWCNPSGRGTGKIPTTNVAENHVHAYLWIKAVGESDGSCFGYPEAGTFVPSLALELSKNAAP